MLMDTESVASRARRLDIAMAHAGTNAASLARTVGITPQSLAQMKNGRHQSEERWRQFAEALKMSADWLINGKGKSPAIYFTEDQEELELRMERNLAEGDPPPPWAAQLLEEVRALRAEVASLNSRLPAPSGAGAAAVREMRAALEPHEQEHGTTPTYPARSPDLTGAPRHGK